MKKLLLFALLLVGGWIAYDHIRSQSLPSQYQAYEQPTHGGYPTPSTSPQDSVIGKFLANFDLYSFCAGAIIGIVVLAFAGEGIVQARSEGIAQRHYDLGREHTRDWGRPRR